MKKLVILSLIAPAILGLAACGGTTPNSSADITLNADDANMTAMDDGNMVDNSMVVSDNVANAM